MAACNMQIIIGFMAACVVCVCVYKASLMPAAHHQHRINYIRTTRGSGHTCCKDIIYVIRMPWTRYDAQNIVTTMHAAGHAIIICMELCVYHFTIARQINPNLFFYKVRATKSLDQVYIYGVPFVFLAPHIVHDPKRPLCIWIHAKRDQTRFVVTVAHPNANASHVNEHIYIYSIELPKHIQNIICVRRPSACQELCFIIESILYSRYMDDNGVHGAIYIMAKGLLAIYMRRESVRRTTFTQLLPHRGMMMTMRC